MSTIPELPTLVFAGTFKRRINPLRRANVEAYMVSFEHLVKDKKFSDWLDEPQTEAWRPLRYLDSGVFTFMRRFGLVTVAQSQTWEKTPTELAAMSEAERAKYDKKLADAKSRNYKVLTDDEVELLNDEEREAYFRQLTELRHKFRDELGDKYLSYLEEHKDSWDWIIELDVEEMFGIELADKAREKLYNIVGDKLLPVWHAHRGLDGWNDMIRNFPYVCISISNALGNTNLRNRSFVRNMIREAQSRGTKVHFLGCSSIPMWAEYGVDTMDSSSWTYGPRVGHFYTGRGAALVWPRGKRGKEVDWARVLALGAQLKEWGIVDYDENDHESLMTALNQAREHEETGIEIGARLLLNVQEEIRASKGFTTTRGG